MRYIVLLALFLVSVSCLTQDTAEIYIKYNEYSEEQCNDDIYGGYVKMAGFVHINDEVISKDYVTSFDEIYTVSEYNVTIGVDADHWVYFPPYQGRFSIPLEEYYLSENSTCNNRYDCQCHWEENTAKGRDMRYEIEAVLQKGCRSRLEIDCIFCSRWRFIPNEYCL